MMLLTLKSLLKTSYQPHENDEIYMRIRIKQLLPYQKHKCSNHKYKTLSFLTIVLGKNINIKSKVNNDNKPDEIDWINMVSYYYYVEILNVNKNISYFI